MWWWTQLPAYAYRLAKFPAATLLDGIYLWVWPELMRYSSWLALALGVVIGWRHPGYQWVFSESLPLLVFLIALGVASGHLGTLFLAGFVVADACIYRDLLTNLRPLVPFLTFGGALAIQYALIACPLMALPVITKMLLAPVVLSRYAAPVRRAVAVTGHVLLTAGLTYCWVNSVPLLIRPMFTWQGRNPAVPAMFPLQQKGLYVVAVAAVFSVLRTLLQLKIAFHSHGNEHIDVIEQEAGKLSATQPLSERFPISVSIALRTVWTALMFGGMYAGWTDALIIAALVTFLAALRFQLILIPLLAWSRFMDSIPMLLRLLAGTAVLYLIGDRVLLSEMRATDTFRPFLVITSLSLVLFFLLNPGFSGRSSSGEEAP